MYDSNLISFDNAKDDTAIVKGVKKGKYAAAISSVWNSDAFAKYLRLCVFLGCEVVEVKGGGESFSLRFML